MRTTLKNILRNVAVNIRRLRGKRSQTDIAEAAGLNRVRISQIETLAAKDITLKTLQGLALVFHVTVGDLLSRPVRRSR